MPKLECITAGAPETFDVDVAGRTFVFTRDQHGRSVCDIPNEAAAEVLLASGQYRHAEETQPVPDERPQRGKKAA